MWAATMAENRIIKLGKKTDFECHCMEHQLGAYTDCIHGEGLAVIHPVYYRHICRDGMSKFLRFAQNVWNIREGSEEEQVRAGIDALAAFIKELGLPSTLTDMGITDKAMLRKVADSCAISPGSYRPMTHEEIYDIFMECL